MHRLLSLVYLVFFLLNSSLIAESYVVTNVKSNDTLNVREKPDYRSKKVGELYYNASGIKVKGCEKVDSKKWCRIEYMQLDGKIKRGWVNIRYLREEKRTQIVQPPQTKIGEPFLNIGHNKAVNGLAVNGDYLITGSDDGNIKIWSKNDFQLIRTIEAHKEGVTVITMDGDTIISGGNDNLIKIWDLKSGELLKVLKGHKCFISSIAVDNNVIISGSGSTQMGCAECDVKIWDKVSGGLIDTLKGIMGEYYEVDTIYDVVMDVKYLIALGSNTDEEWFKVWLRENGKLKYQKKYLRDEGQVHLPKDFTYNKKEQFKLRKSIEKKLTKELYEEESDTWIVSLAVDNENVFCGMEDGKVRRYSLHENRWIKNISNLDTKIIASAKLNNTMVTATNDNKIHVWSLDSASHLQEIDTSENNILSIGLNENVIVTGHDTRVIEDGAISWSGGSNFLKVWSLESGALLKKIDNVDVGDSLNIENNIVSISSVVDDIKLYSLDTGKLTTTLKFDEYEHLRSNHIYLDKWIAGIFGANIVLFSKTTGSIEKKIRFEYGNDPMYPSRIELEEEDGLLVTKEMARTNLGTIQNFTLRKVRLLDLNNEKILKETDHYNIINKPVIDSGIVKIFKSHNDDDFIRFLTVGDEWLIITPEGYFNASENGAKYLNVLTGPMSVTSVDAYYETFYRPDIVKAALAGKKIDTGLAMSDIKPAPQVEIINTPSKINKDETEITLSIKDIGGGIGDIRLYLNGVAVKTDSRAIVRKQSKDIIQKRYTLKLPKGKNSIKALVFNEANTMQSNDALHTITANYETIHKPQLHALIIGIDNFKNPKLTLKYAVSDAQLFSDTIRTQSKGIFSKTIIHKLDTKENTSKEAITQKLKELQNLNPDDLFVFYVASHGTVDDGEYFLITSNVGSTSNRKLKTDAIKQEDLKRLISNVPTTKKLIVLDTCNAGAMGNALLTRGMSEDTAMKILSRAVGSTILSAATSQQQALEGYKEHGLFTYVLTEGLKGKADSNNDGYVKTLELANYIDDEVPELAEKLFNRAQYPVVSPSGHAFPVGRVK